MILPRRFSAQIALLVSLLFLVTIFAHVWLNDREQAIVAEQALERQLDAVSRGLAVALAGLSLVDRDGRVLAAAGAVARPAEGAGWPRGGNRRAGGHGR